MLENYKLLISYDGSRYLGWERQPGIDRTIQGKIEAVLSRMLLAEGELQQFMRGECAPMFFSTAKGQRERSGPI